MGGELKELLENIDWFYSLLLVSLEAVIAREGVEGLASGTLHALMATPF